MKKVLAIIIAAATLIVCSTSCKKEAFGTYNFFNTVQVCVYDASRAEVISTIIQKDSYFLTKHSYEGTLSQAVNLAVDDFDDHIDALDKESIRAQLKFGEYVAIGLWSMDPAQRWITYVINYNGNDTEDKNL